jgi:hypothetical protein
MPSILTVHPVHQNQTDCYENALSLDIVFVIDSDCSEGLLLEEPKRIDIGLNALNKL